MGRNPQAKDQLEVLNHAGMVEAGPGLRQALFFGGQCHAGKAVAGAVARIRCRVTLMAASLHRARGGAQFDDSGSEAQDLDAMARTESGALQPASHEANLRFGEALPEVPLRLNLQRADRWGRESSGFRWGIGFHGMNGKGRTRTRRIRPGVGVEG